MLFLAQNHSPLDSPLACLWSKVLIVKRTSLTEMVHRRNMFSTSNPVSVVPYYLLLWPQLMLCTIAQWYGLLSHVPKYTSTSLSGPPVLSSRHCAASPPKTSRVKARLSSSAINLFRLMRARIRNLQDTQSPCASDNSVSRIPFFFTALPRLCPQPGNFSLLTFKLVIFSGLMDTS